MAVHCTCPPKSLGLQGFHCIERLVRCVEKRSDGIGVLRKTGNSYAHRKHWLLGLSLEKFANPPSYQCGCGYACLRQDHGKFVPTVPCCGVYGPAAVSQDLPQPAERSVTRLVRILVVDLFQSIEVQQYKREFPAGALGSAELCL